MTQTTTSNKLTTWPVNRSMIWGLILAAVLVLITGAGLYTYFQNSQPSAAVAPPQVNQPASLTGAQSGLPANPIAQAPQPNPAANSVVGAAFNQQASDTQTVNGLTVSANFRVEKDTLLADVCYPISGANHDWIISFPYLALPDADIQAYRVRYNDATDTERCATAYFSLPYKPDLSQFKLTIPQLKTSQPEVPDCDQARAKLDAQNSGIVFKCHYAETYFGGTEILKHPESMTDDEAAKIIRDAFVDIVEGPWALTGSLATP